MAITEKARSIEMRDLSNRYEQRKGHNPSVRRTSMMLKTVCIIITFFSMFAMADDIKSVKSGSWSDGSTWDGGNVPGQGDNVLVDSGHVVLYDKISSDEIRLIHVRGTLEFSRTQNTQLDVGTIFISSRTSIDPDQDCSIGQTGAAWDARPALEIGTFDNPIPAGIEARVRLTYFSSLDDDCNPSIQAHGGRMDIHGAPMKRTWVKMAETAMDGETEIKLTEPVNDWNVGDKVIVTRSRRPQGNIVSNGSFRGNGMQETEERIITAINGNRITIDQPLDFPHPVWKGGQHAGEVANLSRNVVIESKNPNGVRGHTMYHWSSKGSISYAEFAYLGKEGVLARYPIHYHIVKSTNRGSFVLGASIHNSDNRWVTVHGTDFLVVKDNVGYKSLGHGYFMEDGTEVYNHFERNLAVLAYETDPLPNQALAYDDNDGAGYWWANGRNSFIDNVANECDTYGYQFEIESDIYGTVLQPDGSYAQNVQIQKFGYFRFKGNESHGIQKYGYFGNGYANADEPFVIEDFKSWGTWYAFRPDHRNMYVKNLYLWNAAYGMYGREIQDARIEGFTAIRTTNEVFSLRKEPEGLITFEDVYADTANSYPFKVLGQKTRSRDCIAHVRNYVIKNMEDGKDGASGDDNAKENPDLTLILHDWFGNNQDAVVIPTEQNRSDGRNYQNMEPQFQEDVRVAVDNVAWPSNPIHINDQLPPAVVITYPANGQTLDPQTSSITVRGVAMDNSNIVSVKVNGVEVSPIGDNYSEWEVTLNSISAGTMELKTEAQDEYGNNELNPHKIVVGIGTVPVSTNDDPDTNPTLVEEYVLEDNYPNPFNPETTIRFNVSNAIQDVSKVTLTIYNVLGEKVRELVNDELAPGAYSRKWDGFGDNGLPASTGVYIYELKAVDAKGGTTKLAKKMMLVK